MEKLWRGMGQALLVVLGVTMALSLLELSARMAPGLILPGAVRNHFEFGQLKDAEKARLRLETGSDQVYRQPPETRHSPIGKPNLHYTNYGLDYTAHIQYNELGLRDHRPATIFAEGRQATMLFLGDSFVEGRQLPYEETLPQQLEAQLAAQGQPWQVINAGIDGSSTADALHLLQYLGPIYQPKRVVLLFYIGNDLRNNSVPFEAIHQGRLTRLHGFYGRLGEAYFHIEPGRPLQEVLTETQYQRLQQLVAAKQTCIQRQAAQFANFDYWFKERSVLYRLLKARFSNQLTVNCWLTMDEPALHPFIFETNLEPQLQAQGWQTTIYLLDKIRDEVTNQHAELLVVMLPSQYGLMALSPDESAAIERVKPQARLQQTLTEWDVETLDLTPVFEQQHNWQHLFLPVDGHLNAQGVQFVAAQIAKHLHATVDEGRAQ